MKMQSLSPASRGDGVAVETDDGEECKMGSNNNRALNHDPKRFISRFDKYLFLASNSMFLP